MDAWNWPNVARRHGIPSGWAARAGAVAVWPAWGKFGHIAVVTSAHGDGTFDVAEYNLPGRRPKFAFDRRTSVSPRGVTFVYVPRRS
jgi:surface antigen